MQSWKIIARVGASGRDIGLYHVARRSCVKDLVDQIRRDICKRGSNRRAVTLQVVASGSDIVLCGDERIDSVLTDGDCVQVVVDSGTTCYLCFKCGDIEHVDEDGLFQEDERVPSFLFKCCSTRVCRQCFREDLDSLCCPSCRQPSPDWTEHADPSQPTHVWSSSAPGSVGVAAHPTATYQRDDDLGCMWWDRDPVSMSATPRVHMWLLQDGSITLHCSGCKKVWESDLAPVQDCDEDIQIVGKYTFFNPAPPRECDKCNGGGWLEFGVPNRRAMLTTQVQQIREAMSRARRSTGWDSPCALLHRLLSALDSGIAFQELLEVEGVGELLQALIPSQPNNVDVDGFLDDIDMVDTARGVLFALCAFDTYIDDLRVHVARHRLDAVRRALRSSAKQSIKRLGLLAKFREKSRYAESLITEDLLVVSLCLLLKVCGVRCHCIRCEQGPAGQISLDQHYPKSTFQGGSATTGTWESSHQLATSLHGEWQHLLSRTDFDTTAVASRKHREIIMAMTSTAA